MSAPLPPLALSRSLGRSAEARLTKLIEPQSSTDSETAVRGLCNGLYALGFSAEYLERRYHVAPARKAEQ